MLSQKYRFHSRGGIRYVYNNGRSIRGSRMALTYIKGTNRKHSRFSVIISKKVLKSAVGRNRIRRRVYESIRLNLERLSSPNDVLVTIYDSSFRDSPYNDVTSCINKLLKEASLYKERP
jgi:ribonuclease P protein component, eubacterial